MLKRFLLALSTLFAPATATAQGAPDFVSVNTAGYDLYASNRAVLDAARPQLDSARAQFSRYFAGHTPKMVVVVAETTDELARFDVNALRQKVGFVLTWTIAVGTVTPGGGTNAVTSPNGGTSRISLLGNLTAAIAPTPDGKASVVRFVPPSGAAKGVDLLAGDVIRAVNGREAPNPAALTDSYNAIAAGAQVRFDIERNGIAQALTFAKPAGAQQASLQDAPPGGRPPAMGGIEPRILSHEAGHYLLSLWAQERVGGPANAREMERARLGVRDSTTMDVRYGNPLLPDWADEAGATISEAPSTQAGRRKYIVDNFGAVIPLAKLFAAEHPALPGLRQMTEARRKAGTLGQTQTGPMTMQVRQTLDAPDPAMFYAQSLSVAEFLTEREGPSFFATLVEGLMRGQSTEDVLKTAKNLPKTVDELSTQWSTWAAR